MTLENWTKMMYTALYVKETPCGHGAERHGYICRRTMEGAAIFLRTGERHKDKIMAAKARQGRDLGGMVPGVPERQTQDGMPPARRQGEGRGSSEGEVA